ncbi:MAG TPA: pyrroline-5-carboxylate reductase [Arcobacter sp.]|nr:pyrroline-5-carboxylate reductase [Arcobacter sp.]
MKLTFLGNGNMAKALIKGLIKDYQIEVLGRNETSLNNLKEEIPSIEIGVLSSSNDMTNKNIILCVKPNSLDDLSPRLTGIASSIYSVLAGTTIETLKESISAKAYIRTMPNLSASYLKSMTTITGDEALKTLAIEIFNNIGTTLWVKSQKELDIATAIAGSGPAYLALIAESLEDGGVNAGLTRADARKLVQGLFEGFSPLLDDNTPASIKDGVMSPGGTTAAGYSAMEKCGVRNGMIEAISCAYAKAKELGQK